MLPSPINNTPRLRALTPTIELARPSRPSIQLIAFVMPVIQMIVSKKLINLLNCINSVSNLKKDISILVIWIPQVQTNAEIMICIDNLKKGDKLFKSSANPNKKDKRLIIIEIVKKFLYSLFMIKLYFVKKTKITQLIIKLTIKDIPPTLTNDLLFIFLKSGLSIKLSLEPIFLSIGDRLEVIKKFIKNKINDSKNIYLVFLPH